jgi:hypothetical protein
MKRVIERYLSKGVYLSIVAAALACVASGCCSTCCEAGRNRYGYRYRVTQDEEQAKVVAEHPLTLYYGPLEYFFIRAPAPERLQMRIINLSDEEIVLVGDWSSVTDTLGISHPLLNRVLAPHSYSGMTLPPEPKLYPPYQGWPGGMQARFEPMSGPSDGSPFYYWPNETFFGVPQPQFDWQWDSGTARLRLEYETEGRSFEHDFVLERERAW